MQMTNLKVTLEPETTLFKEEVDAIIAVVMNTIDSEPFISDIHDGSFLFYGMGDGSDEPQKIIAFDFENGPTPDYLPYSDGNCGTSSREIADAILTRDLKNPHATKSSHISYYVDSPLFLTLRATHGRFACACFGDEFSYKAMTYIYCAVAQAMACMGLEDKVLQDSCDMIFFSEADEYKDIDDLRSCVEQLYHECKLPELALWKKWHDAESENLTLFFE